jgi:hypothetical protein
MLSGQRGLPESPAKTKSNGTYRWMGVRRENESGRCVRQLGVLKHKARAPDWVDRINGSAPDRSRSECRETADGRKLDRAKVLALIAAPFPPGPG